MAARPSNNSRTAARLNSEPSQSTAIGAASGCPLSAQVVQRTVLMVRVTVRVYVRVWVSVRGLPSFDAARASMSGRLFGEHFAWHGQQSSGRGSGIEVRSIRQWTK